MSECCQVLVILLLILIIYLSVSSYGNPIFAYHTYKYYTSVIGEGFDLVVDDTTF